MARISIIVPVHNSKEHLPDCIDGILTQTHSDHEIILVGNGSNGRDA